MLVLTKAGRREMLGFVSVTQAGVGESKFYQPDIMLFTNAIAPDGDTELADLTEATYDGYARVEVTAWSAVFDNLSQEPTIASDGDLFKPTGGTTPNLITGAALVSGDGLTLLGVEVFDNPIALNEAADGFQYAARITLPEGANYGQGIVG